jgi:Mn2+/Fe2+ NRAMP family transporter
VKGSVLTFSAATPAVSKDKAQFVVGLGLWETFIACTLLLTTIINGSKHAQQKLKSPYPFNDCSSKYAKLSQSRNMWGSYIWRLKG